MVPDITDLLKRDGQKLKTILRHWHLDKLEKAKVLDHMGFVERQIVVQLTPVLIRATADEDQRVRENALRLLADLGPPDATGTLFEMLSSTDYTLRSEAAFGLQRLERCDVELSDPLIAELKNEDYGVRVRAAEALFRIDSHSPVPGLTVLDALEGLNDPKDVPVGETVAWLLVRSGHAISEQLVSRLTNPSLAVRLASIKALCLLGNHDVETREFAGRLLKDSASSIRAWSTFLLAQSEPRQFVAELAALFGGGHTIEVRRLALALLARAGKGVETTTVSLILAKRRGVGGTPHDLPIEAFGGNAVPAIHSALNARTIDKQDAAVWLAKIGVDDALVLADQLMADGYAENAMVAYGALGETGLERAENVLKDTGLRSRHGTAVMGLRFAGARAVPLLREQLRSGTDEARRAVALVAAKENLNEVIADLVDATKVTSESVRIASACALARLGQQGIAAEILEREWARTPMTVIGEIWQTGAPVPRLVPNALSELANPNMCLYVATALETMAAQSPPEERQAAIDALENVSGLWTPLRAKAVTAAARLRRPEILEPFPTLRYGPS